GDYRLTISARASDVKAVTDYTLNIQNETWYRRKKQAIEDKIGFPDASNTGWKHTGISLTSSGGITANKDGQVIDGKDINGCVVVTAKNVVIKRSRIRCGSPIGVNVRSGNVTIEDTEIAGTS